jgi:undecaprenyl-diphosphatase
MCGFFYDFDVALFRWVNEDFSSPVLDAFFSFVTNPRNWIAPITLAVVWLLVKGGAKGRFTVLAIVLSVALTDPLATRVIKPLVKRVRPCNILSHVNTPAGGSGAYSFPSVHAANQGASMTVLSMAYPPGSVTFVGIALLVGLSRVYLGLHYPSDILGGYIVGIAIGFACWRLADRWRQKWLLRKRAAPTASRKRGE